MGFSIGSFIGSLAPFVGAALGGPVGAALGTAVSAGLAPSVVGRQTVPGPQPIIQQAATSVVPVPGPGINISFASQDPSRGFGTSGFGVQRQRVGFVSGAARAVAPFFGAGAAAGFAVGEILSRARQNSGQRVTKNKIIDAAKACGIELAASSFGLSETDVCKVIVAGRSRRRRGVSAADVRRTKRTLRFVRSIKKDLKAVRL